MILFLCFRLCSRLGASKRRLTTGTTGRTRPASSTDLEWPPESAAGWRLDRTRLRWLSGSSRMDPSRLVSMPMLCSSTREESAIPSSSSAVPMESTTASSLLGLEVKKLLWKLFVNKNVQSTTTRCSRRRCRSGSSRTRGARAGARRATTGCTGATAAAASTPSPAPPLWSDGLTEDFSVIIILVYYICLYLYSLYMTFVVILVLSNILVFKI